MSTSVRKKTSAKRKAEIEPSPPKKRSRKSLLPDSIPPLSDPTTSSSSSDSSDSSEEDEDSSSEESSSSSSSDSDSDSGSSLSSLSAHATTSKLSSNRHV
jgi:hypothetical protein